MNYFSNTYGRPAKTAEPEHPPPCQFFGEAVHWQFKIFSTQQIRFGRKNSLFINIWIHQSFQFNILTGHESTLSPVYCLQPIRVVLPLSATSTTIKIVSSVEELLLSF